MYNCAENQTLASTISRWVERKCGDYRERREGRKEGRKEERKKVHVVRAKVVDGRIVTRLVSVVVVCIFKALLGGYEGPSKTFN